MSIEFSTVVLTLVVGALVFAGVYWYGRKHGWDYGRLPAVVAALVEEAERTLPGETGKEKLAWVMDRCERAGVTKWVSRAVLGVVIEWAVWRLKRGKVSV